jgi:protein FAM50
MENAREQLKQAWLEEQKCLKERDLRLKYSYWDGSGHQRQLTVKVGDTIHAFLTRARDQLVADFPQMRHATVQNLLFVKGGLILPPSTTFYTFIVAKSQSASGEVLFDVDMPVKEQKAHAAKVVQRHWFESSKHIYPVNTWLPYDEDKHVKHN